MAELIIRPFAPADLPALQGVRRRAFEPIFRSFRNILGPEISAVALDDADAAQARLLDDICATSSGHSVLVAVQAGEIVGFASYTVDSSKRLGEIGLNAVDPGSAGKGVGRAMYEAALASMRDQGIVAVTVGTGGDPSHEPARRAYESCGFDRGIPSVTLYKLL